MDSVYAIFNTLTYDVVVKCFAVLFFLDWLFYLPFFYVGFSVRDEQAGFLSRSDKRPLLLAIAWAFSLTLLFSHFQYARLAGVAVLYLIFRRNYIDRRWTSVRRGFGAPGFMAHWVIFYLLLLEVSRTIDVSGGLSHLVFLALKWDFGWIMICAGTYKFLVGYTRDDGMEYGRANPMWGYFWRYFSNQPPGSFISRIQNWLACSVELACGILLIIPNSTTQILGAIGISLSFVFVALFIRLGRLAFLMAVLPALYLPSVETSFLNQTSHAFSVPSYVSLVFSALIWIFIVLLPIIKIMQYVNLFLNRKFPEPFQTIFGKIAAYIPITMWRVFTPDVTNFFVRVWGCDTEGRKCEALIDEERYSITRWKNLRFKLRALHVTESIALTSVFTTLRYFPSNRQLFDTKLLTYGRSLNESWHSKFRLLKFEFVAIEKSKSRFLFKHVGDFELDTQTGAVTETKYIHDYSYAAPSMYSPVRESSHAGSYAPKTT